MYDGGVPLHGKQMHIFRSHFPVCPLHRAMMNQAAKRRRRDALRSVLNVGGLSNKGLQDVLKQIGDHDDVLLASDRDIRAAFTSIFDQVGHVISLHLDKGGTFDWEVVDPTKLLPLLLESSPALQEVYWRALGEGRASQADPWRIVLTWDEFCPGNKLRVDNRRKCMNVAMNFVNLGPAALTQDWTWIPLICVRTTVIRQVRGGWSHMLREFLRHMLAGPSGFRTAGVPVTLHGEVHLLHATVSAMLSDGDGLRQAYDWRGSAALKPCFKHGNVWKKHSDLAHRHAGHVEITCHDCNAFASRTSAEVFVAVDMLAAAEQRVQAGTMTRARFEKLEQVHGVNTNLHGFLWDPEIRRLFDPVAAFRYDWLHNMLQDGIVTTEIFHFLRACEPYGVRASDLQSFLRDEGWVSPLATRSKSKDLHRIFDEYRSAASQESEKLKCNASEALGLYGMLRYFVATRVPDHDDLRGSQPYNMTLSLYDPSNQTIENGPSL